LSYSGLVVGDIEQQFGLTLPELARISLKVRVFIEDSFRLDPMLDKNQLSNGIPL